MKERTHQSTIAGKSLFRFAGITAALLIFAAAPCAAWAQSAGPRDADHPDLTRQPTLFVVGYAHLDTQWRWDYRRTIGQYLPDTMHRNFALFEKYPNYIFNFSGANRYRMIKEYFPADYARVKQYVATGRWFPAGSSMEESDVNSPSAESIIRQVLYGNQFFRKELSKTSAEFMLPDCFGFPASLPSILAHAGVKGFSTQKLSWGSAAPVGGPESPEGTPRGIPFNIGIWEGPDGRGVIAALNPGSYVGEVQRDLSKSPAAPLDSKVEQRPGDAPVDWVKRVQLNGQVSGLFVDYHYYGTGDTGGAPPEPSVELLEKIVTRGFAVFPRPELNPDRSRQPQPPAGVSEFRVGDGPLRVISATAEQMFLDVIKSGQTARLPRYRGDLLLTEHSSGSISSETYMKRWNRHNELLADAAERASVAADWLGARPYPLERLNRAWALVMGGQFHDILPGTSIPRAYEYAWNDQVLALNQFAGVLTSATEAIAAQLDTQARGWSIVVYNPLSIEREDVVEATIEFPAGPPEAIRVVGPDGNAVPSQLVLSNGNSRVLFLARVPSVGIAVYDIQTSSGLPQPSELKITESSIENQRYRVRVDENGDVTSLFDKILNKELLSAPVRLALQTEKPRDWPAWNMDWRDQKKPPRAYVGGPATVRIIENGPVRVALQIEREAEGSRFVQSIRLAAGDAGNRVEFSNIIDWKTSEAALKATFPLTAANPLATYNWDIGTVARGNNDPTKYEVPSHQWFDLTDQSGSFGVTVLSDCKYGSDKPADNTLRLTLLYTPGLGEGNGKEYADQTTQDWGHHEFVYGLASHAGDWRRGQTDWQAQRLNQPLIAFESPRHPGNLGKRFSLLKVSEPRVRVLALKKAEDSDELIVRLVELDGKPAKNVRIRFPAPLMAAREVDGQERPLGAAAIAKGELETVFGPYQPRTFAVKLRRASALPLAAAAQPVSLPYDVSVASRDNEESAGGFDAAGRVLPAEMLPDDIAYAGIRFKLASAAAGKLNAVVCRGQTIRMPAGKVTRAYILAASADGDQPATFRAGDNTASLTIQDWGGFVGQWDNRIWSGDPESSGRENRGLTPGFIKRAPVAWFASHRHRADGTNDIYAYSYLFAYSIELPKGAESLVLPNNEKVRILAVTVTNESGSLRPVRPLYDTLER